MKTNLFISAFTAGLFFITSCEKQERSKDPVLKVINVDLRQNESYTYIIPASGDADDVMEISQQAQHALTSKITVDGSRTAKFEYTPATDYTGSDEIHIGSAEGEHKGKNKGEHHHGNCQSHQEETETNYIFKINITGVPSTEQVH